MKLVDRKTIMAAGQGALWAGLGMYITDKGTGLLNEKVSAIGNFSRAGQWQAAAVSATTGLLASGLVAGAISRRNKSAAKKAGAYMATGALLVSLYPLIMSKFSRPGGRMRAPTITQALPSAQAAPSTAALRAGGIVMGAPAIDVDAGAMYGTRPGGRYMNPQFEWSSIREL